MIHRTTLTAIPVVGLVVLGAGLGWWGYDQSRQRQALVQAATNQYAHAFHGLISDVNNLHEETDKAMVASDTSAFQTRLRQIWRLSYAAQTDIAHLPAGVLPTSHIQSFLTHISSTANQWLNQGASPRDSSVEKQLSVLSKDCQSVSQNLNALQPHAFSKNLSTLALTHANQAVKQDNQMVDGVKKVDGLAAGYVESAFPVAHPSGPPTSRLTAEPFVTSRQAVSALGQFIGIAKRTPWSAREIKNASFVPEYVIEGDIGAGHLFGVVTKPGGHVLSFHIDHAPGPATVDFTSAEEEATRWMKSHGFPSVTILDAREADRVAYFQVAPTKAQVPVLNQSINLSVSLDTGDVTTYNATHFYQYPITNPLPTRLYTTDELRKKLNPSLTVKMEQSVVMMDDQHQYQPAAAFYGLLNGQTYRLYLNAHTGKEMDVERLS